MKVQKDMIVGLNSKIRMSKYFQSFLFICQHDAEDGEYEEVKVKVFCHKGFSIRVDIGTTIKFKKNELKGIEYKFKTKILI